MKTWSRDWIKKLQEEEDEISIVKSAFMTLCTLKPFQIVPQKQTPKEVIVESKHQVGLLRETQTIG